MWLDTAGCQAPYFKPPNHLERKIVVNRTHSLYLLYRQPTRCKNNGLLLIPISSTCAWRWFRPSSETPDCVYSLWYNAPTMLPVGSLNSFPPHPGYWPAASSVHYTTSCKRSLVLPKMGKITARNMLSWLELITNRYCCIQLVVYVIYINDARSNKCQAYIYFALISSSALVPM